MEPWNSSPYPSSRSESEAAAPNPLLRFPDSPPQQSTDREATAQPCLDDCPPVIAVFSPTGSAGETGIVANLGRALALQGEEVLLLDAFLQDDLARCFGVEPPRIGEVCTVSGPESKNHIRIAQLPIARHDPGGEGDGLFRAELVALATDCDRVLIDLSSASPLLIWQIFSLSPLLLVPVLPGWSAVLSLPAIDRFLSQVSHSDRLPIQPKFLLSQYDPDTPFHRSIREELRGRLGVGLLPMALHRSSGAGDAFDQGRNVLDLHPDSRTSHDFRALADWIRNHSRHTRRQTASVAEQAS